MRLGCFFPSCPSRSRWPAASRLCPSLRKPLPPPLALDASVEASTPVSPMSRFDYPKTRTDGVTDTLFGVTTTDPFPLLERNQKADEVQKWLGAQDALRARQAQVPPRARRHRRAPERALLRRVARRGRRRRASATSSRSAKVSRKNRSSTGAKADRRHREGAPRSERVARTAASASARTSPRSTASSWPTRKKGNNFRRGDDLRHRRGHGQGQAVRRHRGRESTAASPGRRRATASITRSSPPVDGKTVTVATRPGFRRDALPQAGRRSEEGPRRARVHPQTRRRSSPARSAATGTSFFAYIEHGWSATDVYYKDLRKGEPKEWSPLVRGQTLQVRGLPVARPLLRAHRRGGAQRPHLQDRSRENRRAPTGRRSSPSARTRRSTPSTSSAT